MSIDNWASVPFFIELVFLNLIQLQLLPISMHFFSDSGVTLKADPDPQHYFYLSHAIFCIRAPYPVYFSSPLIFLYLVIGICCRTPFQSIPRSFVDSAFSWTFFKSLFCPPQATVTRAKMQISSEAPTGSYQGFGAGAARSRGIWLEP